MGKVEDLVGQKFGRLTVIERAENNRHGHVQWLCQCDCGNTSTVESVSLKSGRTRSCGCLAKETFYGGKITHGQSRTRLYGIWNGMKNRCTNSNIKKYKDYGGRGITICEEWLSFENFYKDAIALGYTDDLTIDRIDVNDGYHFANVRFVSMKVQQNNKRNNRRISFEGREKTIAEWADELEFDYFTLQRRFYNGWSVEEALTTPVGQRRPKND